MIDRGCLYGKRTETVRAQLWREFFVQNRDQIEIPLFNLARPPRFFEVPERLENPKSNAISFVPFGCVSGPTACIPSRRQLVRMAYPKTTIAILHSYRFIEGCGKTDQPIDHKMERRNRSNTGLYDALSRVKAKLYFTSG